MKLAVATSEKENKIHISRKKPYIQKDAFFYATQRDALKQIDDYIPCRRNRHCISLLFQLLFHMSLIYT
jgi:hypothetical protein